MQASIPAEPVPDTGKVNALSVPKAARNNACTSSIKVKKAGSKCPTVGAARAANTRGCTWLGPGPISSRWGGSSFSKARRSIGMAFG